MPAGDRRIELGLGLSTVAVKETRGHARLEAATHRPRADGLHDHLHGALTNRQVFIQTSFREPALSSASQAGLVNNLNDGLAWGLFPILFAGAGLSVGRIGVLAALYPADTDFLYFVANWDGTHTFTRSLRQHVAAKRVSNERYQQWRREQRRKKAEAGS